VIAGALMAKDFARGEHMMRRPDLQQGQQHETDQLQQSSQRRRFQPNWAKQGSALDTSDDDVLPPIPEHLKTNAWMKRYSKSSKNAQPDQNQSVESKNSAQAIAAVPQQQQPAKAAQGSQPQLVAQVSTQPNGEWRTGYVVYPGSKDGTIKMIYAQPGSYGEGEKDVKDKLWPAYAKESDTFHKGALSSSLEMTFDGQIVRQDAKGKTITIPFKKGVPVNLKPGDQIQNFVKNQPGTKKLTQQQRDEAIKKMPYGDKLSAAMKMVPDLLKGDAKAAFKSLTTNPAFVAQLVGVSAAFAALQLTPAGPLIDVTLIATLGLSAGFDLGSFLFKIGSAKDENNLKDAAYHLKNLIETVGIATIAGTLRTASRLMAQLKKAEIAEAGTIRNVNPGWPKAEGRTNNCVNCSIATDVTLAGRPASALKGNNTPINVLEKLYNNKFARMKSQEEITSKMLKDGSGSRGIVYVIYDTIPPSAHVFNVANQGGVIRFLDGQTGGKASFNRVVHMRFMKTN
jgi:hypothetical protein